MKRRELLRSSQRMPNPIETALQKTEWTATAKIMEWLNSIIQAKNLSIGIAEVETTLRGEGRRPDIIIYRGRNTDDIICLLEFKPPYFEPDDEDNLKEPARKKATKRQSPYFAISNFQHLILFNTTKANEMKPLEDQLVETYHLSGLEDLNEIEEPRFRNSIIRELERFLIDLTKFVTGKKVEPLKPLDHLWVWRLQDKVNRLARHYKRIVIAQYHKESEFKKRLKRWFAEQIWEFNGSETDFAKAARQAAYLLVNKIVFYSALQTKRPRELTPLHIPEDLIPKGGLLRKQLQIYFDEALNLKYETIYSTDFIDSAAFFPDNKELIREIRESVKILKRYNFSTLRYDIIGYIFERLIPQEERHNLGQYFTNSNIVDLILGFCLRQEQDKILDPACGAGTFLVRAYHHKKLMNQKLPHLEILNTLWGVDIAKFPAHLSTINLASRDLAVDHNYPHIWQDDFFKLKSSPEGLEPPEKWRKVETMHFKKQKREVTIPRWFDCIIGNPPYTRQEEIPDIGVDKSKLIHSALYEGSRQLAEIGKRAGIHTYFFTHGWKFLRNNGRFGFIVSNSWLDVDYGKGLQEFFLKHYKILAIIESKVERWFEEADINTCIVILEKCKDPKERDKNPVRFVYLKKPLANFIPPAEKVWAREKQRIDKINELIQTILFHNEFYENEDLRIFPKKQADLWDEGFDKVEGKYAGTKWGKYLRAPEIFFRILQKGKGKLVPLKDVADVVGGIITGNNKFFYFDKEVTEIEEKFLQAVIKTPRELNKIIFTKNDINRRILFCNEEKKSLKGTKVLKYIQKAEKQGIHNAETFRNRTPWYSIPDRKSKLLWVDIRRAKHLVHINSDNILFEHNFYGINPHQSSQLHSIAGILNSTFSWLLVEILGMGYGGGGGPIRLVGVQIRNFPVVNTANITKVISNKIGNILKQISSRNIESAFSEIGTIDPDEVSLDKVKPDRRELDKIIMGDILGLTEEEQLEVYRAVVDLVKSRIDKAKTFGKRKKTKEGVDIELLVKNVMTRIGEDHLGRFYKGKILTQAGNTRTLPEDIEPPVRIEKDLFETWSLSSGKHSVKCNSEVEARYLAHFVGAGLTEIHIPKDRVYLKGILPELTERRQRLDTIIEEDIRSLFSPKTQKQALHLVWQTIMGLEA